MKKQKELMIFIHEIAGRMIEADWDNQGDYLDQVVDIIDANEGDFDWASKEFGISEEKLSAKCIDLYDEVKALLP